MSKMSNKAIDEQEKLKHESSPNSCRECFNWIVLTTWCSKRKLHTSAADWCDEGVVSE